MTGGEQIAAVEERDSVAALAPESPLLFAWARLRLREIVQGRVERLLVGRRAEGCWSVLHDASGWMSARGVGEADVVRFGSAREAVADAMAGIMIDAGVRLNSELLKVAGVVVETDLREPPWRLWRVTDAGRESAGGSDGRPDGPGIVLDDVDGRPMGYFVCVPRPRPDGERGGFVTVRKVFALAVAAMLPPDDQDGTSTLEVLPEGTELHGSGGVDEVFLFEPGTPFVWQGVVRGGYKDPIPDVYHVQRPLPVYPGFPVAHASIPDTGIGAGARPPTKEGRGYYLVEPICELLRSGHLTRTPAPSGRMRVTFGEAE
ncbi:hypothetical protein [Actinomadura sediminis]|uniref:DUF4237 domain-containing protein n=1 Tax=Actinomadura sediminis TaxID=1038904 RepID=A0ABW3ETG4_9ACTN